MLRKKKPLNILAVVIAALLLCWVTDFGLTSAEESKTSEAEEHLSLAPEQTNYYGQWENT